MHVTRPDFLGSQIRAALCALHDDLNAADPLLAQRAHDYSSSLASGGALEEYFASDWGYPIFTLPAWLAQTFGHASHRPFLRAVTYATLNGYLFTRLLDDVMDADRSTDLQLLPLTAFFHSRFERTFARYFTPRHAFWKTFDAAWLGASAAAVRDAALSDISLATFQRVSAQKCAAGKIPVAAVCHRLGAGRQLAVCLRVCDLLGCVVQMADDLVDWPADALRESGRTYVLCEAERRRRPGEDTAGWLLREGLRRIQRRCDGWLDELSGLSEQLGCEPLGVHVQQRRRRLALEVEHMRAVLGALAPLTGPWKRAVNEQRRASARL